MIPRAKEGSLVLEQILSANRIDAEILSIYDVRGARTENWKYLNNYDAILFASASGCMHLQIALPRPDSQTGIQHKERSALYLAQSDR